ncbi:hypothetical protein VIGAN_04437500 [Vigna angularis var. angularis]|uniref:Uncharacterized protein n=1 Tax=Vigna angularis var. angularis TaxID=157739 RepID=A0A0S3S1K7_PHAAN|nr:hypothetical protein VIGAN_04437500 [Vigna angularis var. angularis]
MAFERSTAAPLNSAMTYDEESMERSKTPCKFPLSYLLFSLFLAVLVLIFVFVWLTSPMALHSQFLYDRKIMKDI